MDGKKRAHKTPQLKRAAFLAAYATMGNISAAARAAKVRREDHYQVWMKDEKYAEAFDAAQEEATQRLEHEARRRAAEGLVRKKFTAKGVPVIDPETGKQYVEHEYSDTLLIFLLKGLRPGVYRDHDEQKQPPPGNVSVVVQVQLVDVAPSALPDVRLMDTTAKVIPSSNGHVNGNGSANHHPH